MDLGHAAPLVIVGLIVGIFGWGVVRFSARVGRKRAERRPRKILPALTRACTRKSRLNVRFAPTATELLRRHEMTQRANNRSRSDCAKPELSTNDDLGRSDRSTPKRAGVLM
jgi:hypothetical protein